MAKRTTTPDPDTTATPKRRKVAPAPQESEPQASNGHALALDPSQPVQPIAAKQGERTETRVCPVALTERERLDYGQEQAECELQIERLKGERALLSKASREHEQRRNKLGHIIDAGVEERSIECVWRADYVAKEWRLLRCDSGSVVESRTMTGADLVQDLSFDDDSAPADDGDYIAPPPPDDDDDDDSIPSLDTAPSSSAPTPITRLPPPPRRSDGSMPPASTTAGHDIA